MRVDLVIHILVFADMHLVNKDPLKLNKARKTRTLV